MLILFSSLLVCLSEAGEEAEEKEPHITPPAYNHETRPLFVHSEAGEDAEEAFLENLEPAQQREVAEGYRAFIDG